MPELTHEAERELDKAVAKELDYAIPHLEGAEAAAGGDPTFAGSIDVLVHLAYWLKEMATVPKGSLAMDELGSSSPDSEEL